MYKYKKILSYFVSAIILIIFIMPFLVQAQGDASGTGVGADASGDGKSPITIKIDNPFKQGTIEGLINVVVKDILMPIGGVVAVMMIIYAGFMYVTAGGDPGKIKRAHDALLWAVIGSAILLGAWVISQAISATISQLKV